MKLLHPDLKVEILDTDLGNCCEWVIESPELFTKYIQELKQQINRMQGNFVLSEDEKELEIAKYAEIIIDPFAIDVNDRKIVSKLYSDLAKAAYEEDNYLQTMEIQSALQKYLCNLEQSSDYILEIDSEVDISALFKTLNIKFESFPENIFEQVNQYVKVMAELAGKRLVILINFCSYFSVDQLDELIKNAAYHEIFILLIESQQKSYSHESNRYIIIDKDGCEIC
jgi:CRISPR-associated protein Csn2